MENVPCVPLEEAHTSEVGPKNAILGQCGGVLLPGTCGSSLRRSGEIPTWSCPWLCQEILNLDTIVTYGPVSSSLSPTLHPFLSAQSQPEILLICSLDQSL